MSKAQEALPPSYDEAIRGTDATFAGASAPVLPSPEHALHVQNTAMPMPSVAPAYPGPLDGSMPHGVVPVPPMAVLPSLQPPMPPGQVPMYPVQQSASAATTVYVSPLLVGPKPFTLNCPVCHQKVRTTTTVTNSGSAHAICILMCLLGCCCCSCLPYCFDSMKITKHECPSCKAYLGSYKP